MSTRLSTLGTARRTSRGSIETRSPATAARALLQRGPAAVLLTRGAEGATVVTAGGDTPIEPVATPVIDTIGAGGRWGRRTCSAQYPPRQIPSTGLGGSTSQPSMTHSMRPSFANAVWALPFQV